MTDSEPADVTRPQENPTLNDVYEEMVPGRCYVVADLVVAFEDTDATRWTIQNRLNKLDSEGRIKKRKHANDRVTYRRPRNDE